jgi:hypothetical protein
MVTFLAELNGLELWATDVGNAFLESYTSERVLFKAGPEFGDREGHTRHRTHTYGLRSSGARWHDKLADVLRDMGFKPSLSEEDIWDERESTNTWRYTWMTSPSLARNKGHYR